MLELYNYKYLQLENKQVEIQKKTRNSRMYT